MEEIEARGPADKREAAALKSWNKKRGPDLPPFRRATPYHTKSRRMSKYGR
jgi:hypothetical protein